MILSQFTDKWPDPPSYSNEVAQHLHKDQTLFSKVMSVM